MSDRRNSLYEKFQSKIIHNSCLDRTLVSFQGNKQTPFSWFKYREGFSERLVTYLIQELKPQPGILLDPFSGIGSGSIPVFSNAHRLQAWGYTNKACLALRRKAGFVCVAIPFQGID